MSSARHRRMEPKCAFSESDSSTQCFSNTVLRSSRSELQINESSLKCESGRGARYRVENQKERETGREPSQHPTTHLVLSTPVAPTDSSISRNYGPSAVVANPDFYDCRPTLVARTSSQDNLNAHESFLEIAYRALWGRPRDVRGHQN